MSHFQGMTLEQFKNYLKQLSNEARQNGKSYIEPNKEKEVTENHDRENYTHPNRRHHR